MYAFMDGHEERTLGIDPHQITKITDLYLFQNNKSAEILQTLQILQIFNECMVDRGLLTAVYISKHSLFRLKITVGSRLCACPSIRVCGV